MVILYFALVFSMDLTVSHAHAHAGNVSCAAVSYLTGVYRVASVPVRFCIGSVERYRTEKKRQKERQTRLDRTEPFPAETGDSGTSGSVTIGNPDHVTAVAA